MNSVFVRIAVVSTAVVLCMVMRVSRGSVGCMDTSLHGGCDGDECTTRVDRKKLHYVACQCPCKDIIAFRGECTRCYHYGNPERGMINALQRIDHNIYQ